MYNIYLTEALKNLGLPDVSNVDNIFNFNINNIILEKLLDNIDSALKERIMGILRKIQVCITHWGVVN